MRADGGEAVEVRKREGLAEGTNEEDGRHGLRGCSEVGELVRMRNEEDGRHGLRGCSEVGELVRMRSKRRRRGAVARRVVGGVHPWEPIAAGSGGAGGMRADGGEAVEVRRRGAGRGAEEGTAAMVSEAVRRSASWSACGTGCMPARQTGRSRRHAGRWR